MVSQETKAKLPNNCSTRCGDFDGSIRRRREGTSCGVINIANHDIGKVHSKNIVGIGEAEELVVFQEPGEHTNQHQQQQQL